MTEPQFDMPPGDGADATDRKPETQQQPAADAVSGGGFDDERTVSYSPPPEPHTAWAPPGWAVQTPPHWFEPLPDAQPPSRRSRGGSYFLPIFLVALLAALIGSGLTYAVMMATGRLTSPVAQVVEASPTPIPVTSFVPGESAPPVLVPATNISITQAAQDVSPAVVTITVQTGQPTDPNSGEGIGSGIIYDSNGYVLTNRHVVSDATTVSVALNDGRTMDGTVYGIDTLTDLAIVKIDATGLATAPIGDSATLQPGQTAIVIGSPLGTFTNSVTSGVVSALGRSLGVTDPTTGQQRRLRNLIQTDAAINPGNSGGPLVNSDGQVVGVSTAYAQGAQGIFFAIPINIAKPIMAQAVAGQPLTRPWIGIVYQPVDQSVAQANNLAVDYGAWIAPDTTGSTPPIVADSPAEKAGLKAGDIITSIDGHRIDAGAGLDDVLSLYNPGDTLTIQVLRDGQTIPIEITLGTRPANLD